MRVPYIPRSRIVIVSFVALLTFAVPCAVAEWIGPDDHVPVERLVDNLNRQLSADPDNAKLLGQIARVHSLAYALDPEGFFVQIENPAIIAPYEFSIGAETPGPADAEENIDKNLQLYEGPDYEMYPEAKQETTEAGLEHLRLAIQYYSRAVALPESMAHHWLGLGYTLLEASRHAEEIAWPFDEPNSGGAGQSLKQVYEGRALEAYWKAFELGVREYSPSAYEAAVTIRSIIEDRPITTSEDERQQKVIRRYIAAEDAEIARPRPITPIIFPLDTVRPLESLLAPEMSVAFDLAGDASGATWPWVRPDTALLVWDPQERGEITSGRQLIGSVTWWLFWNTGYEVLASLDDDGDGWLTGGELAGLAAWQDRNGNAVSDPGEVRPVRAAGIRRIAARQTGTVSGMPFAGAGVEFNDGRMLPTYDWIASPK